jgi:hydrogenase maturation protease
MRRILVAGIGNLFFADDAFGVEVAKVLAGRVLPDGVEVVDAGIRGLHLAHRLLEGYDLLIAADATSRGGDPGTLYLLEADDDDTVALADAHGIDLASLLATVRALGGTPPKVLIVGCEPAELTPRIGLSDEVAGAVAPAVERIWKLVTGEGGAGAVSSAEGK